MLIEELPLTQQFEIAKIKSYMSNPDVPKEECIEFAVAIYIAYLQQYKSTQTLMLEKLGFTDC